MQLMTWLNPIFTMLASIFQKILAVSLVFGSVITPSTETPIRAINPDDVRLTFTALGDTQVNAFNGNMKYFEAVLKDVDAAETNQDALVIVGDITENSLPQEWDGIKKNLLKYDFGDDLILASGNHDIRLRNYEESVKVITGCMNDVTGSDIESIVYSKEINGYKFIVMGSDREEMEEAYISIEQLEWVDKELKDATKLGKPVFVFLHQPLRNTHGLPGTWGDGSNPNAGHVGKQSDLIFETLNKYDNVILVTGHLHTGFGENNYEKIGNIHGVNVPGAGKNNKDGDYCEFSTGYSVEVYDNEIIFRARDYAKGEYLPEYDIYIPVE